MRILLVGDANSIFFVHYVKALKKQMDAEIHVYSPIPDKHNYCDFPYDKVFFDDYELKKCSNIRYLSTFFNPYVNRIRFGRFLKRNGIKYDIMHFHWILPEWVICPKAYYKYAENICYTPWGGEMDSLQLLKSHKLYLKKYADFIKKVGTLICSKPTEATLRKFPFLNDIRKFYGVFGSSIIDAFGTNNAGNNNYKKYYNIDPERITVVLGYSGKSLHNHDKILKEIVNNKDFDTVRDKLHFIFPMTRGAEEYYINELERILAKHNCHYNMIKGNYMSDEDVVKLRKATDVMFQLSDFDGLSSSVKECLCAGTIMISGNWFAAYSVLKEIGFKYLEVESIKEGVEKFYEVMNNFEYYKDFVKENMNVGQEQFSWDYCIKNWSNAYQTIANS